LLLSGIGPRLHRLNAPAAIRNHESRNQSRYQMSALGAHREFGALTLSEIPLSIGGVNVPFRSADVLLEKPPMHYKLHGVIGLDLLNSAPRVTLDLKAMRLTLE
jgi:hypothetical protein